MGYDGRINARLPQDIIDKICYDAASEGLSVSEYLRKMIDKYYEAKA